MKEYFVRFFILIVISLSSVGIVFGANGDWSPVTGSNPTTNSPTTINYGGSNILGVENQSLRDGDVDMSTIPQVIVSVINVLLGIAGTISIAALIYYALRMQAASGITGDSSQVQNAQKGMRGALLGFVLAILAWFIVIRFVQILSSF